MAPDRWPLTGRAEELGILHEVLRAVDDGGPRGAAIIGRPGVGKTRLLWEVSALAEADGWRVQYIAGTVAGQSVPLGAFAQWATSIGNGDPVNLIGDVIEAVTATDGQRVLIAVDDAHSLDELSAFIVFQLVLRGGVVLMATIRSGEHVSDAIRTLWKDRHVRRVDLQPLSRKDSHALLQAALDGTVTHRSADRLWHLTAGNTLFLRHLVAQERDAGRLTDSASGWQWTGDVDLSDSLIDLIAAQVGAIPPMVGEVVDLVAVAEPLALPLLRSLTDRAAIEESERRGLITVTTETDGTQHVRVGHPLYGELRLRQSGHIGAARLRGRIATRMADPTAGVTVDPVRLGRLWTSSDLAPDQDILAAAARAAYARGDLVAAAEFAEAAVAAGAPVDVRLLLAHTLSLTDRPEVADVMLAELAVAELPDPLPSIVLQLRAANRWWPLADLPGSWAIIDDALTHWSADVQAEARCSRALQLATAGRPEEACSVGASVARADLATMAALMLGWAMTIALGDLGRSDEADAEAATAVQVARAVPEAFLQSPGVLLCRLHARILAGRLDGLDTLADSAIQLWCDVPGGVHRTFVAAIAATAYLGVGDLPAAMTRLHAAVDDPALPSIRTGLPYFLAVIYLEAAGYTGDRGASTAALEFVERHRHPAYEFLGAYEKLGTAWCCAGLRLLERARDLAVEGAELARSRHQYGWEVRCRQTALQLGGTGDTDRLTALSAVVQGIRVEVVAGWAQGLAADDPDALFTISADLENMGDRIAAADAAAHAAHSFDRAGRHGDALIAGARATRLAGLCRACTPATRDVGAMPELTERERQIAEFVGAEMSNQRIADELTLSVRTVEGHVLRLCRRLGLADRGQLAALMREAGRP